MAFLNATNEKIRGEIQSLSPDAVIELFTLDFSNLKFPGTLNFHAGTNELRGSVIWQGTEYVALPIEAEGFDMSTNGVLPRPKVRLANMNGMFSAEIAQNRDLIESKVIRKRTLMKYLDAENFTSGVNATADPNQFYPNDIWFVEQKLTENRYMIEWELTSAMDLSGVLLPNRQVIQNSCPWKYRGVECGYAGVKMFDTFDVEVFTTPLDVCGKRLDSCKARKDEFPGGVLPYGGFPGARRYAS